MSNSPNCLLSRVAGANNSIEVYQALQDGGIVAKDSLLNRYAGGCGHCVLRLTMESRPGAIISPPDETGISIHSGAECTDDDAAKYREQIEAKFLPAKPLI